jgi:hypothetical protein
MGGMGLKERTMVAVLESVVVVTSYSGAAYYFVPS